MAIVAVSIAPTGSGVSVSEDVAAALRVLKEMPSRGQRREWPEDVMSMIWSSISTGKLATTGPPRMPLSMAATPMPPRPRTG